MKALPWILILILSTTVVAAQLETSDLYKHSYLILQTNINSDVQVRPKADDFLTDYVLVKLFFAPVEDDRLEVLDMKTVPKSSKVDGALEFRWDNPDNLDLEYGVNAKIKTKTLYNMIPNKVPFPIKNVPDHLYRYTLRTDNADFGDPLVRKLANELAEGEDDLYIVANKAAIWVRNNIQYNLTTVTLQASKPASWVIRNKKGVCDELTNLHIAIMRSLGVPARFISGVAYTNSKLFDKKWGPHGWAEVWFPQYGWVPFDPTYGQFGWLDPSHVKLKESLDASEASTKFEWRGRHIDLDVNPLNFDVDIVEKGGIIDYKIDIDSSLLKPSVGFGSHNVIKTTVENLNNYYLTTDVSLANTQGLDLLSPQQQTVILRPYETAEVFWTVKVEKELKENFIYTFPVMAYDLRNVSSIAEFTVSRGEPVFSKSDADRFIRLNEPIEEKNITMDVSVDCFVPDVLFLARDNKVTCALTNTGNTVLPKVTACMDGSCHNLDINIGETKETQFRIVQAMPGKYVEPINVDWESDKLETEVYYTLLDKPVVTIADVNFPGQVAFKDVFDIEFTVKQESFANVPNGNVRIIMDGHEIQDWTFPNLDQPHTYRFTMRGSDLKAGNNKFEVIVDYTTKDGAVEEIDEFKIILSNLSVSESIVSWMNRLGLWIAGLF